MSNLPLPKPIDVPASDGSALAEFDIAKKEEMLVKAELASRISQMINKRHLTQAEAARLLGLDQPKVSALLRGKLTGFSIERLLKFLTALDLDVQIVIKHKPKSRKEALISVIS